MWPSGCGAARGGLRGLLVRGSNEIAPRAVLTEQAPRSPPRSQGEQSVAKQHTASGWLACGHGAVCDHGQPHVDHLARLGAPSAIGLDETSFLATTHHTQRCWSPASSTSTQQAHRCAGCAPRPRRDRLAPVEATPWLAGIHHVVIDPYQPYATVVAAQPDAPSSSTTSTSSASPTRTRRGPPPTRDHHRPPRSQGDRSIGSSAASSPATSTSSRPASPGCSPGSTSATPTARSAPATWPKSCREPTSPTMSSTPAGASPVLQLLHLERRA